MQQQVDAIVAGVSDFLARFGWPIALALLAGWCAWSALQPWMREAANQRAIRCVLGGWRGRWCGRTRMLESPTSDAPRLSIH